MCDHLGSDCFCEADFIVLDGEPPKTRKKAKDSTAHHDSTVPLYEELQLVRVASLAHGEVTRFVATEPAVRAELLHQLGGEMSPLLEQDIESGETNMEHPTSESLDGDLSGTQQLKDSFVVEEKTADSLALLPIDDAQGSLFEETKKSVEEILQENLHQEATIGGGEEQEEMEDQDQAIAGDAAIAEVNTVNKIEEMLHETDELENKKEMEVALDQVAEISLGEPAKEMESTDDQVPEAPTEVAVSTAPEAVARPCLVCAHREAQKLKFVLTQDPFISLEAAKLHFEKFEEAKEEILQDATKVVEVIKEELHFAATELGQDLDQVIAPVAEPAVEVAEVIIDGLIEDGGKLADVLNRAMESAADITADRILYAADLVLAGIATVTRGLESAADVFKRVVDTMTSEEVDSASTPFTATEEPLVPPTHSINLSTWVDEEEKLFESKDQNQQKQTPLRWLASVVQHITASADQSASISLAQWPAATGLSEWPISGRPSSEKGQ